MDLPAESLVVSPEPLDEEKPLFRFGARDADWQSKPLLSDQSPQAFAIVRSLFVATNHTSVFFGHW
jgi:hypothetical protein